MTTPGPSPAGRTPAGPERAGKAAAGRQHRLIATSIGITALLALGGGVWASGVAGAPGSGSGSDSAAASAAANDPAPQAVPEAAPGAGPAAPEAETEPAPDPAGAGAPAPLQAVAPPAPAAGDPAPVDRKGKSEEELAAIPQPVAAPVDLASKKTVKGGVSATITEMTAVKGEANGVGEVAGPAVRFKVTVLNETTEALPLDGAVVDVSFGNEEQPASRLSGPGPAAFPASVAPGESGAGVFIFAVPLDARDKVKIHFNLEAETPIATFAGKAPA